MNKIRYFIIRVSLISLLFFSNQLFCQDVKPVQLPAPDTSGGKPLMQVLKERKTTRTFSDQKLSDQVLSNLLWAAFGINRADGHRTAPSAMNWQEIDVYVAMENGLFLYDAKLHALVPVLKEDIREKTGTQDFVKNAPLNLVYVSDSSKTKRSSAEQQLLFTGADCGFIAENVYLYCASEGLACVVRGSVDKSALAKAMNLRPEQKILLAQTVGYKK
jgi:SagB-type dehydrogenase family enzyme